MRKLHQTVKTGEEAQLCSGTDLDRFHVTVMYELNKIRSHVIKAESMLLGMHSKRHPIPKPIIDMSPTQPLSQEDRDEIDSIA